MYCNSCGIEIPDASRFCHQCGTPTGKYGFTSQTAKPAARLSRPRGEKKIAGVCAGIARYLGVDVTLIRVVMAVLALWPPGTGLLLYLICWIVMPQDPLLLSPPAPLPAAAQNAPAA